MIAPVTGSIEERQQLHGNCPIRKPVSQQYVDEDFENIPLRGVQPVGYSPMQDAQKAGNSRASYPEATCSGYTP